MMRQAKLVCIENNRPVAKATDSEFWFQYQRSVLLALKQAGGITEMQYRNIEEKLAEQRRALLRKQG